MEREIPASVIETFLTLGSVEKEQINNDKELIDSLQGLKQSSSEYAPEEWQTACESLARESQILLFRGLVYADILIWGPSSTTPVNAVFGVLNRRCWPDTVYRIIGWAMSACAYHEFDTSQYVFAQMLASR